MTEQKKDNKDIQKLLRERLLELGFVENKSKEPKVWVLFRNKPILGFPKSKVKPKDSDD